MIAHGTSNYNMRAGVTNYNSSKFLIHEYDIFLPSFELRLSKFATHFLKSPRYLYLERRKNVSVRNNENIKERL